MAGRVLLRNYKPQSILNAKTIAENAEARRFLPGPAPHAVIVVLPEDVQLAIDLTEKDPHTVLGLDHDTYVTAWVVEGALFDTVSRIRSTPMPPGFHFKVFSEMKEARTWVDRMLAGSRAA